MDNRRRRYNMGIDILIIIAVVVIVYGWLAWEAMNTPTTPADRKQGWSDEDYRLYKEMEDEANEL